jgi:dihydrofolate reductase
MGKPIIMGRQTFQSIGKPLPGRLNVVLSQNPDFQADGCRVARTFDEALAVAQDHVASVGGDEAMVIGGGNVYEQAMARWDRLYITVVDGPFQGTVYFPVRELLRQRWRPACPPETHPADEKNPYPHSFHIIERLPDLTPRSMPSERGYGDRSGAEPDAGPDGLDLAAILARGTIA